jgi:hypothetical protein
MLPRRHPPPVRRGDARGPSADARRAAGERPGRCSGSRRRPRADDGAARARDRGERASQHRVQRSSGRGQDPAGASRGRHPATARRVGGGRGQPHSLGRRNRGSGSADLPAPAVSHAASHDLDPGPRRRRPPGAPRRSEPRAPRRPLPGRDAPVPRRCARRTARADRLGIGPRREGGSNAGAAREVHAPRGVQSVLLWMVRRRWARLLMRGRRAASLPGAAVGTDARPPRPRHSP